MTLLENAKAAHHNSLNINETVCVKTNGRLHARKVIFVSPPISTQGAAFKTLQAELEKCYQNIFTEFAKNAQPGEELMIPCFSTGKGYVDSQGAAVIATETAAKFLKQHPDKHYKVRFICFVGDKNKANLEAYRQVIESHKKEYSNEIAVMEGRIEEERTDTIVCPIQKNFDLANSGPIAHAICEKADEQESLVADEIRKHGGREMVEREKETLTEDEQWLLNKVDAYRKDVEQEEIRKRNEERVRLRDEAPDDTESELKVRKPRRTNQTVGGQPKSNVKKPTRKKRAESIDENEGL